MMEIQIINWVFQILTGIAICIGIVAFTWYCIKEKESLKKWEAKEKSIKNHLNNN